MSDTILAGDVTVYYLGDNRQKRLEWSGAAGDTRSVNEVYSALQDLLDELPQMDDGTPMSAQTPTEYTIGIVDPGDKEPWFVDKTTAEHFTGAAITTAGWTRVTSSAVGVVRVQVSANTIIQADIGGVITHGDGDSGVLLDVVDSGTELWIRPDDDSAPNNFDSAAGTLTMTVGARTATQNGASETGESLWAGIFGLGTIETDTHLYVYQDGAQLTAYKGTDDWWADGLFDILVNVKECDLEVDEGFLTVFARQYSKLYDEFETDLTNGGRNPIPLATADDLNNTTGNRLANCSAGSVGFVIGEVFGNNASRPSATKLGVVTAVAGTVADPDIDYYLIGDLTAFAPADTITGYSSGSAATVDTVGDTGPALLTTVTIVHAANETFDIDEDGTTENYSIVVDCVTNPLSDVYEVTKHAVRRGDTVTTRTDGIEGERYRGSDRRIVYDAETGTVPEGNVVTQVGTGAFGTVVAHNATDNILILRNSRGTFNSSGNIEETPATNFVTVSTTPVVIVPVKAAPFGTFAGGVFFGAPGVVFANVPAADANNFQLIDDNGNVVTAPTKVSVTSGNTRQFDSLAIYRLDAVGGNIDKAEYTVDATQGALGATLVKVDPAISAEAPTTGRVVVVDVSTGEEHIYRYLSRATDEFTLFNQASTTMEALSDDDTIIDTGAFASVLVGDIIYNVTRALYAYVDVVVSANEVTLDRAITGQVSGDSYVVGATVQAYVTSDTVYVPFILDEETVGTGGAPGSESTTVTYTIDIPVRARVRQAGVILPYEADGLIQSTGFVATTIRTADPIFT